MKRTLTWLLAAMMLLSLAACGSGSNNGSQTAPGQNAAGNATTENNGTGNNSINNGTDNNGTDGLLPGDQNVGGTNDTMGDNLFGDNENGSAADNNRTMGTSYEQMLRNARVHDTNGDLSDLENAYTPGSLGW